ncbi:hypothetical protein NUW54_g279 [Trametes sanguinea]|uniref:Uncharacterized protein n=1 Tax=Trametes sanguinea TaxID=158606 RepID=A0ACC1Q9M3_9APHY|nr:hypothetical protein NUW54_g279 [Trametes sanguinea]
MPADTKRGWDEDDLKEREVASTVVEEKTSNGCPVISSSISSLLQALYSLLYTSEAHSGSQVIYTTFQRDVQQSIGLLVAVEDSEQRCPDISNRAGELRHGKTPVSDCALLRVQVQAQWHSKVLACERFMDAITGSFKIAFDYELSETGKLTGS